MANHPQAFVTDLCAYFKNDTLQTCTDKVFYYGSIATWTKSKIV